MNEIFTPYKEDYGYGWVIDKNLNRKRVHHSGGGHGFSHQFHRYIDDKVTILVLSNYGFSNSLSINERITRIVFDELVLERNLPGWKNNEAEEDLLQEKINI